MGALSVDMLVQLYACFCLVFDPSMEKDEVDYRTSMHSGCFAKSRFYSTMQIWVEEITPEEMMRFRATCQEVHRFVTEEDMLVATFASSRWYSANESLSFWRQIRKECVQAATFRGWSANVWSHAVVMIEAEDPTEFDGWYGWLTDCNYDDLRRPAKNDRVAIAQGLAEHLTFSTEEAQEVVAILATFMLCSHCRTCWYWAFMVVLKNGRYAAVRLEDYANPVGIDWDFSQTLNELRHWSIDEGGRVLLDMSLGAFPNGLLPQFHDVMQTLTDSMIRIGKHKRRACDGVAYTWTEFVQWYGYTPVTDVHWRAAGTSCCE